MKLKYYVNNFWASVILAIFILLIFTVAAGAYTLSSSSATPSKIYKCQPSVISATFSDFAAITAVTVIIENKNAILVNGTSLTPYEEYAMQMPEVDNGHTLMEMIRLLFGETNQSHSMFLLQEDMRSIQQLHMFLFIAIFAQGREFQMSVSE